MEIIGFTYEADTHCVDCATARFPGGLYDEPYAEDGEGNQVHPMFDTDEHSEANTAVHAARSFASLT